MSQDAGSSSLHQLSDQPGKAANLEMIKTETYIITIAEEHHSGWLAAFLSGYFQHFHGESAV
ncbi:hypothetical protein ACP3P6_00400 [Enterobacter mori]